MRQRDFGSITCGRIEIGASLVCGIRGFVQPFCCFGDDYLESDEVPPVGVEVIVMDA